MPFSGFLKPKPDDGRKPMIGKQIITPTTANQAINFGFHDGTGYAQGDANLIATNILVGSTIFGIAGTGGKRYATGTVLTVYDATQNYNQFAIVSGLAFVPRIISIWYDTTMFCFYNKDIAASSRVYASAAGFSAFTSSEYVNSSAFKLWVRSAANANQTVTWEVWE